MVSQEPVALDVLLLPLLLLYAVVILLAAVPVVAVAHVKLNWNQDGLDLWPSFPENRWSYQIIAE